MSRFVSVVPSQQEVVGYILADGRHIKCEPVTAQVIDVLVDGEVRSSHLFWSAAQVAAEMQGIKRDLAANPDAIRAILPKGWTPQE